MKYCRYHPLIPATYKCDFCEASQCDFCIDEGFSGDKQCCFLCNNEVQSLGARYSADPFWRRFQEVFRYPLKTETIVFIIGMAILNVVIEFLPFTIIWFLILLGIFMKYCFTCLEKTAKGSLIPPDITTAYEGGIVLSLKLIAILFIIGFSIIGVQVWLGTAVATFFGVIALCCCPAIIINFSLSESVIDAVNPLKILYLITSIGLPYGLLLAIILIMFGSVSFINELISSQTSYVSLALQLVVSNFYTIVIFHLMGYMLFQYQGQLGFIARHEDEDVVSVRGEVERTLANIEVHVKEGYYDKALLMFQEALQRYGKNKLLHDKCLELLLATKNIQIIDAFAPIYINFLAGSQAKDQLTFVYKKILKVYPSFTPKSPEVKLLLAQECHASGDPLSAVRLLNKIYQQSPSFNRLIPAMELMLEALKNVPNMEQKAIEFDLFLKRFKEKQDKNRFMPKAPIKPIATIKPTIKSKIKKLVKGNIHQQSLSLEEQIKNNAEKYNTKKPSVEPNKATEGSVDSDTKNNKDYGNGIDFS
jgi:tetratricopeptide (TPR) repeat protein